MTLRAIYFALVAAVGLTTLAFAHPHAWIDVSVEVFLNASARVVALTHRYSRQISDIAYRLMISLSPSPADRIRSRQRHMIVAFIAVWAILAQAFIPAFHHHDGVIGGWHENAGSNQPDNDDSDDCPICQAAHAIGTAVLLGAPSSPILVAMVFRTVLPDLPGHIDRRKTDRPRQRAPPPLI